MRKVIFTDITHISIQGLGLGYNIEKYCRVVQYAYTEKKVTTAMIAPSILKIYILLFHFSLERGMVGIKEPLLLIGKSSICGGSGFSFSLSEWSLTMSDAI